VSDSPLPKFPPPPPLHTPAGRGPPPPPSMLPNRVPTEREAPNKEPSHEKRGNIWSVTVHRAPCGWKASIQVRPGSPRGSFKSLQSLLQCHAAFSTIPSTMAWVDQSPVSSLCRSNPHQGMPSITVTASHMSQGRVEYEFTIPQGTDEGLDLWEALSCGIVQCFQWILKFL